MKRSVIPALSATLFLFFLDVPALAGNHKLEEQLRYDYLDRVMTLRHFYDGDHLRFRSDGTLQDDASVGPWTIDSQVAVQGVRFHGSTLEIKGRRIYLEFDPKSKPIDVLETIGSLRGKERKDLEETIRQAKVTIEIELPPATNDIAAVSSVLRTVFLDPGESMMKVVPEYWSHYFAKLEGRPATAPKQEEKVYHLGGGVSAPRLTFQPDPEYSEVARKLKYQGTVVLSLIADPAGTTRDFQITLPLGLGLDEQAVAAVSTWKLEPAMKDGVPVPVQLSVEVTFRLY